MAPAASLTAVPPWAVSAAALLTDSVRRAVDVRGASRELGRAEHGGRVLGDGLGGGRAAGRGRVVDGGCAGGKGGHVGRAGRDLLARRPRPPPSCCGRQQRPHPAAPNPAPQPLTDVVTVVVSSTLRAPSVTVYLKLSAPKKLALGV